MERAAERRAASANPALRKSDATPVHAKASGIVPPRGSTG
jgi:hypothetical protein